MADDDQLRVVALAAAVLTVIAAGDVVSAFSTSHATWLQWRRQEFILGRGSGIITYQRGAAGPEIETPKASSGR